MQVPNSKSWKFSFGKHKTRQTLMLNFANTHSRPIYTYIKVQTYSCLLHCALVQTSVPLKKVWIVHLSGSFTDMFIIPKSFNRGRKIALHPSEKERKI